MREAYGGEPSFRPHEVTAVDVGFLIYVLPINTPQIAYLDQGGLVWVGLDGLVVVLMTES